MIGDLDLYLFGEGRHHGLWRWLGAHVVDGGTRFAVWAPNAQGVSVVCDANGWNDQAHPLAPMGGSGVWAGMVANAAPGCRYKYSIRQRDGRHVLRADPMAQAAEPPPANASVVWKSHYSWGDTAWLAQRGERNLRTSPCSVYEVHLGSWRNAETAKGWRPFGYRDATSCLPDYCAEMGFTHVEFLPLMEHPLTASWGYQVTGYYAPTARYGTPDDLRGLIDALHQRGIGVLLDWVPAHFPKDDWALYRFDGTPLYEHADPQRGEHPDWGTAIFNEGRHEVRNFLLANARYWIEEFHVDGLRVDAVASMLYLDYSRQPGEWVPNRHGGRENLEAIDFLRNLNAMVTEDFPGVAMIAEESTAWPGVTRAAEDDGLGFTLKWNMGWMHDTLEYLDRDSVHRRYHHHEISFPLWYAFDEQFLLPLSHDEVVHEKRSLLGKMPGDRWQQLATVRALYGWMWAHPGKQLLFMGGEFAQLEEWTERHSLDWHLLDDPSHLGVQRLVRDLNQRYGALPALWERDGRADGFRWIDINAADQNLLSFLRFDGRGVPGLACIANFSPSVHRNVRVGLPLPGVWRELLNTDATVYGGSGVGNAGVVLAEGQPWHGQPHSAAVVVPPLGVLWLTPA